MRPMDTDGDAVEVDPDATETAPANGAASVLEAGEAGVGASEVTSPDAGLPVTVAGDEIEPVEDQPEVPEAEATDLEADEPEADEPEEAAESVGPDELDAEEPEAAASDLAADDALWDPIATPPEMSQMLFVDVVLLLPATNPVVVLQEADPPYRELRIPVGGAEGIAIGYAARGLATPRPLTHELFAKTLEEFGLTLDVVRITAVRGTAFTAEMVVSGASGVRLIDCRPSDAIALALRQRLPVPIMAAPSVLTRAGTDPAGAN